MTAPILCECGKKCYDSRSKAMVERRRFKAKMRAYLCPMSLKWHLSRVVKKSLSALVAYGSRRKRKNSFATRSIRLAHER